MFATGTYAEWRYFTGDRSIPNIYFDQASAYCEATTISDLENPFILPSNKGASKFINLPSDNISINILTDFFDDINFSHLKSYPPEYSNLEKYFCPNIVFD